jgi:hypothetical protein
MSRAMTSFSMTQHPTAFDIVAKTPVPVEVLFDILRRPRFSNTEGESYVIQKYLAPLPGMEVDGYGNYMLLIPNIDADDPVTTMFSSHTDTVHKMTATDTYKLSLRGGWLSRAGGGVLGADCGTGIWIMLNLINAGVPGLYVFHRDEEIGGKGSTFFAEEYAELLGTMEHCIAFDRKGETDIITHQGGTRCCSEEFAAAFAGMLNLGTALKFKGDDTGSFTDSANYTHLIPECTNLAIGYYDQHTQEECQDLTFVSHLINKLISLDFSQLPSVRDPSVVEDAWDDFNFRDYYHAPKRPGTSSKMTQMIQAIEDYPGEVADILIAVGYSPEDLLEELADTYGCDTKEEA